MVSCTKALISEASLSEASLNLNPERISLPAPDRVAQRAARRRVLLCPKPAPTTDASLSPNSTLNSKTLSRGQLGRVARTMC